MTSCLQIQVTLPKISRVSMMTRPPKHGKEGSLSAAVAPLVAVPVSITVAVALCLLKLLDVPWPLMLPGAAAAAVAVVVAAAVVVVAAAAAVVIVAIIATSRADRTPWFFFFFFFFFGSLFIEKSVNSCTFVCRTGSKLRKTIHRMERLTK